MNTSESLLAPYETGYNKNQTLQLTQQRKNQQIFDSSKSLSGITWLFFSLIKPLTCCFGDCVQVQPRTDIIVSRWGVVEEVLREPGVYFLGCAGLETNEVDVGGWQTTINDLQVNDTNAFPCYLSATYNYQVADAISATYKVYDYKKYLKKQAKVAMKRVFSEAIYNQYDSFGVEANMLKTLQDYVTPMGLQINSFKITAVKIDSNMQKQFLAKQEAMAYVNGRHTIAKGATSIVKSTLDKLGKDNIVLTSVDKNALVVDLIYMIIQNDDVKIRFIQGDPSDVENVLAITTEQAPQKHKGKHHLAN